MTTNRQDGARGKGKLSKNVLQMKFMQRSHDNSKETQLKAEEQQRIDDTHWALDLPELNAKENKYETEPSFAVCKQLKFGRMSTKGMNPAIETIMRNDEAEENEMKSEQNEREMTVTDEEMARRFSSLVNTVGQKLQAKRERSNAYEDDDPPKAKKKKFKKPSNE